MRQLSAEGRMVAQRIVFQSATCSQASTAAPVRRHSLWTSDR
jgi:hypothetical protein